MLLVLAVWVPAALGVGLLARTTFVKEESAALRALQDIALRVNGNVEAVLDSQSAFGLALANSEALRSRDLLAFHQEALALTDPGRRWVVLVERDRQVANSLFPAPRESDRAPGAPFLESTGRRVFFTARGPVIGGPVIGTFVPERTRPVRYNVGVAAGMKVVQSVVDAHEYPLASIVSVLNDDALVMARSRDPDKWIGTAASAPLVARIRRGDSRFAPSVTLDGESVLSYISPPNAYGWRTIVSLPSAVLAATARSLTLQAVSVSALLLLIGLLMAMAFARTISESVLALRASARELAGNRPVPSVHTPLAEANEVAEVLRESSVQILQFNTALEARVQQAVTQAKQSQAQLVESQKREAIGRLTSGLAHDFNNLLQTISMGLELSLRTTGPGPHERALQNARDAAARAADLVRQLQTFGRSAPTAPEPVDLPDFVLRSTSIMRNALGRGIELDVELESGLPPVRVDPAHLELAVLNLIFNARDALQRGGHVVLSGRRAAADESLDLQPGEYVAVEVVDNGVGIPADALSRVLEPYFTTKPVGMGTGLGLAQVHAFALQSGGDLRIQSVEGEGTRVTLMLPVATAPAAARKEESPLQDVPLPPVRILVVEDDPLVASVVAPALEAEGHTVELLTSADAAVLRLSSRVHFDVVFTDVVMPGAMDGLELAMWVREHRPDVAVLVATGYAPRDPEAGSEVLRKPYRISDLLNALATLMRARA